MHLKDYFQNILGVRFRETMTEEFKDEVREFRGDFRVLIEEDGREWEHFHKKNLVTNVGRKILSRRLGADLPEEAVTTIQIGQNGSAGSVYHGAPGPNPLIPRSASATETDLFDIAPFSKVQSSGSPFYLFSPPQVYTKFVFCIEKAEANGAGTVAYTEAGLFNVQLSMFAIQTFPAIVKLNTRKVVVEWTTYF